MTNRKKALLALAVSAVAVAGFGTAAIATPPARQDNDEMAGPRPAISLAAAVSAAEQRAGGYAVRAEYEQSRSAWGYDIEIVTAQNVMDVRVDATSGQVLSATPDSVDQADEGDDEDGAEGADHD